MRVVEYGSDSGVVACAIKAHIEYPSSPSNHTHTHTHTHTQFIAHPRWKAVRRLEFPRIQMSKKALKSTFKSLPLITDLDLRRCKGTPKLEMLLDEAIVPHPLAITTLMVPLPGLRCSSASTMAMTSDVHMCQRVFTHFKSLHTIKFGSLYSFYLDPHWSSGFPGTLGRLENFLKWIKSNCKSMKCFELGVTNGRKGGEEAANVATATALIADTMSAYVKTAKGVASSGTGVGGVGGGSGAGSSSNSNMG